MSDLLRLLLVRTNELEAGYPSSRAYLDSLREMLAIFVPVSVKHKDDKEEVRVRNAYEQSGAYSAQLAAISIIKEIEMSHVLGCNDYAVPHLVNEYARLRSSLKQVELCFDKMKQFPKAAEVCAKIKSCFEKDKVALFLKDDLGILADKFNIEIDVQSCLDLYKGYGK